MPPRCKSPEFKSGFKFRPVPAAVMLVISAPIAPAAWAQSSSAPDLVAQASPARLPEVEVNGQQPRDDYAPVKSTIGGKAPTNLRDIPQSVTVINRAVMDAQGVASLQDALRNVPGITIGGAEGGQIGNNINLRGFSARTDIFLDGVRDRAQYYRDTFFLDSVEVLKGPSSMLFGRGSTGGVINQVSKVPTLEERSEVTATLGTSSYARTTADIDRKIDATSAFRINLMGQDVSTTRDTMTNKDYGFAPSLRLGIGTPTEITLSALIQHNNDQPDYGISAVNGAPAGVSYNNFYGLSDDRTTQDVAAISARIEHKFSPALTLRNQLQTSYTTTDARETGASRVGTYSGGVFTGLTTNAVGNTTSLPLSQLYVLLGSHDRKIQDRSIYNQTDLIANFESGAIKHTLIAGVEIGRDTYANQAVTRRNPSIGGALTGVAVVSLTDPVSQPAPSNVQTIIGNRADSSANTLGAYVNDTVELNPQWKLVGGVRWDRFDADLKNSVTLPLSATQNVHFTSLRGGALYQPTETQSYYVSTGTSFNPSLETLTVTSGQQALAPEKNRSYEAGSKWDLLDGNLTLTSALFRIEKQNARSQISTGVYQLDGTVRVNGFEAGVSGRINKRWQVIGGYTYLDAKIVSASALDGTQGKVPANTPRHSATLWTVYALTPEWEIGGGPTYMSQRYASNTDVVTAGGFTRWDGMLTWHQPKYDLRLNLINIGDKQYINSVIPSDGGRSVPGVGRTALATVAYRF